MRLIADKITPLARDQVLSVFTAAMPTTAEKREAIALLVAQSALETGRWRSIHWYNFGNIKPGAGWLGDYCQFRCNEVIAGKVQWFDPPHPQTSFRAYASPLAGAQDYLDFLSKKSRYRGAWVRALAGDPVGFSRELRRAGYYTASEAIYTKAIVSLYAEFLPLVPVPPVAEPALPSQPADPEHSTITAEDVALLHVDFDWETFERERRLAVLEG
jgi:hypothetical protein